MIMKRFKKHLFISLLMTSLLAIPGCGTTPAPQISMTSQNKPNIAICWNNAQTSYSYESTFAAVGELDANVIKLDMVRSFDLQYDEDGNLTNAKDENGMLTSAAAKLVKTNTWQNSDVEEVLKNVDAVIFPGGSDISPTLYYTEQPCHGIPEEIDYCAERDVSDYILMDYCLDHDIPVLAICRGMQMLSVVSGADMIQDVGTWYTEQGIEYTNMHRDPEKKELVPHGIEVTTKESLLYQIIGQNALTGCPSWHHQIVGDVSDTRLMVTAQVVTDDLPVIEAVERTDKTFCLGVQFHPEIAVRKHLDQAENADLFMDYDTAMLFFKALAEVNTESESMQEAA